MPKTITLARRVREALDETVIHIIDAVKDTSDRTRRSSPGHHGRGIPLPEAALCSRTGAKAAR